jgi:hypothetical protein
MEFIFYFDDPRESPPFPRMRSGPREVRAAFLTPSKKDGK